MFGGGGYILFFSLKCAFLARRKVYHIRIISLTTFKEPSRLKVVKKNVNIIFQKNPNKLLSKHVIYYKISSKNHSQIKNDNSELIYL